MDIMLFLITVIAILASCCFYQASSLSPDLKKKIILHYDFEEIDKRFIFDASGYNNTAVMENNVSQIQTGCRHGLNFSRGYLNITMSQKWRNITFTSPLDITIAVWIKIPNITRKQPIFTSYFNSGIRFHHFVIRKGGGIRWFMQTGQKKKKIFKISNNKSFITSNHWHHLAVTFSNKTRRGFFYINGTAVANATMNSKIKKGFLEKLLNDLPQNVSRNPIIGGSQNTTEKQFFGEMDEYYIFSEALNETDLKELMKNCTPVPPIKSIPTTKPVEITAPSTPKPTSTTKPETTAPTTKKPIPTTKLETTAPTTKKNISETKAFIAKHIGKKLLYTSPENLVGKAKESNLMRNAAEVETSLLKFTRNTLKVNGSITLNTEEALILMSIPSAGFMFPANDNEPSSQEINETLTFPDEIVQTGGEGPRAVICISYMKLHKVLPQTTTLSSGSLVFNVTLHSKIIGAAVDPPLTKQLNNPIEVVFIHDQLPGSKQVHCSFWDYSGGNGTLGQWSTKGCEFNAAKSSPTKTVCQCYHLTNFALLLQRDDVPYNDPPISLKIITIIGCTLSILACPLCFIMFRTLRKKDIRHYLHINLSVAIAVSQLIFIFGITKTEYKVLCKALAVGLHYFYLAAFFLMLCEGVHLAILIEAALKYGGMKLPVYLIISWGLPLVIVGITLGVRFDNYGGPKACFISPGDGSIYAFIGPFALVVLINFVILVMVLRQVVRKSSLPISTKAATKRQIVRTTIKSLVILFPVMSLTWIFGILYFGFQDLVLEYFHGIFSSLQGFLIFLFQFVLNTENRAAFIRASQRLHLTANSTFNRNGCSSQSRGKDYSNKSNLEKLPVNAHAEGCQLILYRKDNELSVSTDERTVSTFT